MKAQITKPIEPYKRDGMLLRVRVDFTPEPSDPLYDGCHVQVPERPLTEEERPEWEKCETDECRDALLVKWGIAKVWQTNPINCHFFYLPIGFTDNDLNQAIAERMVGLKGYMAERAATGHGDISVDSMPMSLRSATCPPKGQGQSLIPTLEKKWTPALVEQAGQVLSGREITEAKS